MVATRDKEERRMYVRICPIKARKTADEQSHLFAVLDEIVHGDLLGVRGIDTLRNAKEISPIREVDAVLTLKTSSMCF